MTQPLVSIIVPVFNAKDFCKKCFESLLSIDYPQKEIILVDDCSTDGSHIICDEYSKKNDDITVIHHQHNGGATRARITGVEHAHADIIMFVDSDDYVDPNILTKMTEAMLFNHADMVCCQVLNVRGEAKSVEERSIFGVYDREGIEKLLSVNLLYDVSINKSGMPLYLCGKLFKRSLLSSSLRKGLEIKYEEDLLSVVDMLANGVEKLVVLNEPFYYYTHHNSQVTSKKLWDIYPSLLKVWKSIDAIGTNNWKDQLSQRIWMMLKPSIYDKSADWSGIFISNKFIQTFHILRNSDLVKKYIWNNKNLPKRIKNHPHYFLLKYKLYWLDYFMYLIIWGSVKK